MLRFMTIAALVLTLAGPAWAEETLYCVDTAVNGFFWEKGKAERTGFESQRITVRVKSDTERWIKIPGDKAVSKYVCKKFGEAISCHDAIDASLSPFIFKGDRFERVQNFAEQIGGDYSLYVAYGTCTKF